MIVDQIKKRENKLINNKNSRIDIPVGKWVKCENCKEILYKENLRNNLSVCPNCGHYFRMHIGRRLKQIIDEGTYKRFDLKIDTVNPLELEDYPKKLKKLREKSKINRIFLNILSPKLLCVKKISNIRYFFINLW